MAYKSRGNYPVTVCLKRCANRNLKCDKCIGFSEYKNVTEEKRESKPRL